MKNLQKINKKIIYILIFVVILASTVLGYFFLFKKDGEKIINQEEQTKEIFKLILPINNSLIIKEIYIKKENVELKKLEKVLEIFFNELPQPMNETKIYSIFRDKENKIYLNLSGNFATSRDAKNEFYLIKGLYSTIKTNFNWITDVKILISNEEKETLSGHIPIESLKESVEAN